MPAGEDASFEQTPLLHAVFDDGRNSLEGARDAEAASHVGSHLSEEEEFMSNSTVGERLPYNDYCSIDMMYDLVGVPD